MLISLLLILVKHRIESEHNARVFAELIVQLDPVLKGLFYKLEIVIHLGFLFFTVILTYPLSSLEMPWL